MASEGQDIGEKLLYTIQLFRYVLGRRLWGNAAEKLEHLG
jgi:hypothetical protein